MDRKNKSNISKLRLSAHQLKIEKGRYSGLPREERLCNTCQVIEDELHFVINCDKYKDCRKSLMETFNNNHPDFINASNEVKFIIIMSSIKMAPALAKFICKSEIENLDVS